ncbi:MucR family transcriptional regulator [Solidesulfovibrio alcoholivorans]|uniref:MucR family transcriptional regulator n=1 Tax=Solidesulfovibrio alcoholivorans TaxID=81406 RepID=UPI000A043B4B|nr:MucR family transcriptional regulator [Solidesulfovibrio alcoholivorans]
MIDKKLLSEAKDIAKDQMRHGKIHYSDFEKATKAIYDDLLQMENLASFDVSSIEAEAPQIALSVAPASKFKHEKVAGKVRCAECGNTFKTLSVNHLRIHGITREEYMVKYGLTDKDMQGDIERKVKTGDDNALTIMSYIMKEYDLKRAEVKPFVTEYGFSDIKGLMAQAKDKGIPALNLLKEKAPASKKKEK